MAVWSARYMVKDSEEDSRLVSQSLQQFVRSVGARTAAPGGGSVSAAVAAMVMNQHECLLFAFTYAINMTLTNPMKPHESRNSLF